MTEQPENSAWEAVDKLEAIPEQPLRKHGKGRYYKKPKPSPYNAINKPEQPNTELLIVKTVQGLISAVNRELGKLDNMTPNLSHAKPLTIHKALKEIDSFEKTTLFELQKAFE